MAAPAALASALALSLVLAGSPQQHDLGGGAPYVEMLRAGSFVGAPLVELHASPEPAGLELVAGGVGGGAEVSVRVLRSSNWGGAPGAAPPPEPALDDTAAERQPSPWTGRRQASWSSRPPPPATPAWRAPSTWSAC